MIWGKKATKINEQNQKNSQPNPSSTNPSSTHQHPPEISKCNLTQMPEMQVNKHWVSDWNRKSGEFLSEMLKWVSFRFSMTHFTRLAPWHMTWCLRKHKKCCFRQKLTLTHPPSSTFCNHSVMEPIYDCSSPITSTRTNAPTLTLNPPLNWIWYTT